MKKLLWRIKAFIKKHKKTLLILVLALIGSIFIFLIIPLIIQWIMTKPSPFPNPNIANNDWIGFWGGYLGALVGAGVTLLAVVITIKSSEKQIKYTVDADSDKWKKQIELDNTPFFTINFSDDIQIIGSSDLVYNLTYNANLSKNFTFDIENAGKSIALNPVIVVNEPAPFGDYDLFFMSYKEYNLISPSKKYSFSIAIQYSNEEIKTILETIGTGRLVGAFSIKICYDTVYDSMINKTVEKEELNKNYLRLNSSVFYFLCHVRDENAEDYRITLSLYYNKPTYFDTFVDYCELTKK